MSNKTFIIVLVVAVGGMTGLFLLSGGKTETTSTEKLGTQYEEVSAGHVAPGQQTIPYNTIPATSGDHGERTQYGERTLTDYEVLHGLEHGGISFWYNPDTITDEELAQVRETFNSFTVEKRYLSPRSDLPEGVKLSMASWGWLLEQSEIDTQEMSDFFNANINKGPELAP